MQGFFHNVAMATEVQHELETNSFGNYLRSVPSAFCTLLCFTL